MRYQKKPNGIIECIIHKTELKEKYNISLSEMIQKTSKSYMFLNYLMQKLQDVIKDESSSNETQAYNLEVSQNEDCLIVKIIPAIINDEAILQPIIDEENDNEYIEEYEKELQIEEFIDKNTTNDKAMAEALVGFPLLGNLINSLVSVTSQGIESSLYKNKNMYYLHLKGSIEFVSLKLMRIQEFGGIVIKDIEFINSLDRIIKENAIEILQKLL